MNPPERNGSDRITSKEPFHLMVKTCNSVKADSKTHVTNQEVRGLKKIRFQDLTAANRLA